MDRTGGSFILTTLSSSDLVTPEDFTGEQKMLAEAAKRFLQAELIPQDAAIESLNYELTLKLLRQAGEMGLLGADVPEEYGGIGLDKVSTTLLSETLAASSSFALSVGAHTGIGTLPIVYFGTEAQKKKYLPSLASGERIAAYCLTEPASGSDALGAKTTAKRNEAGTHYILNGSKLFITNAGFADLFIVYAKVDGEQFTAFIVEKDTAGLVIGPEEKKMGIKGSSTCPLYFEDMAVPVENVLGEVGKGHRIAFNILNIGRFKLGAGCVGAAKETIQLSAQYAKERKQFGQPIASFPLIAAKLADMNILSYVSESMVYRTAGLIDEVLTEDNAAAAISQYALECSIVKVFVTEALDTIADEGVQIHGGYGYIQEYKVERIYRDARINRIFEGTNEINRMLIPGTLLKKAMKGELPLLQAIQKLQAELLEPIALPTSPAPLSLEQHRIAMAKKTFLTVGGLAVQKFGMKLEQQQEVLACLADMMILIYAMESACVRAIKLIETKQKHDALVNKGELAMLMTEVYVQEAMERLEQAARLIIVQIEQGDNQRMQLSLLRKLMKTSWHDSIAKKRVIAAAVIRSEHYVI